MGIIVTTILINLKYYITLSPSFLMGSEVDTSTMAI